MIEKAGQLSLRRQCELLGLNRAGLHYQLVAARCSGLTYHGRQTSSASKKEKLAQKQIG
jgi:hypothetical protein